MTPVLGTGKSFRTFGGEGLVWFGSAVTSGGIAVFHPTDDGTATGNPCFSAIEMVCHSAVLATGTPTSMPLTSTKDFSNVTVSVNCVVGTVLGVVGATMLTAPDGTVVKCMLWGMP